MQSLLDTFGNIDIYLFDQLLKGRLDPSMRVLDAGCGGGRNIIYLLQQGFDVFGVDENPNIINAVKRRALDLAPSLSSDHFAVADVASLPFEAHSFDAVLSSAVLHFARNQAHFETMIAEMWRVLKPEGLFFARLATTISIESRVVPKADGWYDLPDGTSRFLANEAMLLGLTNELGGILLDPIKTTNVQNLRAMTTWVLQKQ